MSRLVQEKVAQAIDLLAELEIDCWLTFVRESAAGVDPVLPLILGHDVTWQSAFLLTREGQRCAIMGRYDAENARRSGAWHQVIPYDRGVSQPLLETLQAMNPARIALNFSANDAHADGLGHGLYLQLMDYLKGTPFVDRIVSAEMLIGALRGRKTAVEVERIRAAVATTAEIYNRTFEYADPGMSEKEIGTFMHRQLDRLGLATSWERANCPAVHAGPDTPIGHSGPTDLRLERGQILHFDFGLIQDDYASDIQRVVYYLAPDESAPPAPVQHAFDTIVAAIDAAVGAMQPGVAGHEVDAAARKVVVDAGYPAYRYATGHQVGRSAHDGGAVLAPLWERYGDTPKGLLEVGQVYAVEPGLMVEGYGYLGLEENVVMTEQGAEYLGAPQRELLVQ